MPGSILAARQLERIGKLLEPPGQGLCGRHGERAPLPFKRDYRPAEARCQQQLLDRHFERGVMRDRKPARISRGFAEFRWNGVARRPQLCRLVVDGVGAAQHLGPGISGVAMNSTFFERQEPARLIVAIQHVQLFCRVMISVNSKNRIVGTLKHQANSCRRPPCVVRPRIRRAETVRDTGTESGAVSAQVFRILFAQRGQLDRARGRIAHSSRRPH